MQGGFKTNIAEVSFLRIKNLKCDLLFSLLMSKLPTHHQHGLDFILTMSSGATIIHSQLKLFG